MSELKAVKEGKAIAPNSLTGKLMSFVGSYANPTEAMSLVNLLSSFLPDNKYGKVIKSATSVMLTGHGIYTKFSEHVLDSVDEQTRRYNNIAKIMGRSSKKITQDMFYIGEDGYSDVSSDSIAYLLHNGKSGTISVIKCYSESFEEISTTNVKGNSCIYVYIKDSQKSDIKSVLVINVMEVGSICAYALNKAYIDRQFNYNTLYDYESALAMMIVTSYIASLNLETKIIRYDSSVFTQPRKSGLDFSFKNVDYSAIRSEIENSLALNMRRGIILAGNPGTGKTTALLQLESDLTCPIIYVSPNNIETEMKINSIFNLIELIKNCLVVFEDFDGYELEEKGGVLSPILNKLDMSHSDTGVVYIATVNDASKLNSALTRPGRFDTVINFKEPSSYEEYQMIIKHHAHKIGRDEEFKLSYIQYLRMRFHKFSCADICDVVDRIVIGSSDSIKQSVNGRLQSRKALKEYS